jgi:epsilon-lactone hydrolase
MGALEFLLCLALSAVRTTLRRALRGPLLPSWSWTYEVVTGAQKRFNRRVALRSPRAQRRAWNALKARGGALRQVTTRQQSVGGVSVLWFTPKAQPSGAVVLYLHGGGFMYGSAGTHGELCARLAVAASARIAFICYRLAPEHPFPAALDDADEAYRALLRTGVSPGDIVLAGDSAGGNLVLALMIRLRDAERQLPAGGVLISPWVDLCAQGGSLDRNARYDWAEPWMFRCWADAYLGGANPGNACASPARADLNAVPPLHISVGGAEMLLDQVLAFAEQAQQAGVDVTVACEPERVHQWLFLTQLFPQFQTGIDRIGQFIRRCAGGG